MVTILGYLLVATFMVLVIKQKLSPFTGLIAVSLGVGAALCLLTGQPLTNLLVWMKEGIFYTQHTNGKIGLGTVNPTLMILFAILYFSLMMNVGLFDPLCAWLIRRANGDPLKITLATFITAAAVTLDGDGTTTIIIMTTAFVPLYRQMGMKLSNLAMLIILPFGLGNCLPWGGPLARAAAVLQLDVNDLFITLLPVLGISFIYVAAVAFIMGKKERVRLGYEPGSHGIVSREDVDTMVARIHDHHQELKRPRLLWLNLLLTAVLLVCLMSGLVSGAMAFLVGTALALMLNYTVPEQRQRLIANGGDAIAVASIIVAAGCFLGVFRGSGMAAAVAQHLASLIPASMGSHSAILLAFLSIFALYALPLDAYYFGVLPVIAPIAHSYGITPTEIGIASVMGQALRHASPTVAWLYLLMDRTEMSFWGYQKTFFKWSLPIQAIFIVVAIITGQLPTGL
ncbi:citrate:proton symporter [Rahnella woolbedingensis]|uniref:TRAP transporter large permease subunit n=1 Tax=Rahnella woolbedingensis TaxID=1510574 RepID=A0A419N231_9GAMM|nr:citrate:proton symporter [Rahnella woolbedingensis]RJT33307.1 TRAP transporter large permease subunit [Rahnella woolbedingensis]